MFQGVPESLQDFHLVLGAVLGISERFKRFQWCFRGFKSRGFRDVPINFGSVSGLFEMFKKCSKTFMEFRSDVYSRGFQGFQMSFKSFQGRFWWFRDVSGVFQGITRILEAFQGTFYNSWNFGLRGILGCYREFQASSSAFPEVTVHPSSF